VSKLNVYLTDRSRIVTREGCERKRFLNYDFDIDGEMVGVQKKSSSLPLLNGIEVHEAHARLLAGHDLEEIVASMRERYRDTLALRPILTDEDPKQLQVEQLALLEAMLRAFKRTWLPRILEDYDLVSIEKPMDWKLAPGLVQKLRFDVVLRRKGDGMLIILDYKTMAYPSDSWSKKLERSRQTSLYILAAQELFQEPVEIAYLGLIKGIYAKDTAKASPWYGQRIQKTPYLYAYALMGSVGNVYETEWTNKKGFQKIRTYEAVPGGIEEWVDWLWHNKRDKLQEMFVFNPPFAPTQREMQRVRELVVREELEYVARVRAYQAMVRSANGDEHMLAKAQEFLDYVAAPMREESCYQYGLDHSCSYLDVCFNGGALERLLEDGGFEARESHHATTLEEAA
jgi:hypothetical protein